MEDAKDSWDDEFARLQANSSQSKAFDSPTGSQKQRGLQKYSSSASHIFRAQPFRLQSLSSKAQSSQRAGSSGWNTRHHVSGAENEMLPKPLRAYFSRPQSLPELKAELTKKKHAEAPPLTTFVSADAGPPICPDRHKFGGAMRDRDGEVRPWNDRWHTGIHLINETLHPLHRGGFASKSLFEKAKSQRWRRHLDFEIAHGVWKPIDTDKPLRFPPLGV